MNGPVVIRIHGLNGGGRTPYDGKLLSFYDPVRPGADRHGDAMIATVEVTDDPAEALRFVDVAAAHAFWRSSSGRLRPDGMPDRPLTAFHIEIEAAP